MYLTAGMGMSRWARIRTSARKPTDTTLVMRTALSASSPAAPMPAALAQLGSRICIFGPSNSGKSTLAATLGQRLSIDVIHLDQLHHLPHTDWQPRPNGEFHALHDAAIQQENWIIEGNYSSCIPQRLARATGLILLDISTGRSLFRYLRRTLLETERIGDV